MTTKGKMKEVDEIAECVRIALLAYVADWFDTRIGSKQIWARCSPEKRQELREAQYLMRELANEKAIEDENRCRN